jgi:hypothetical protein
MSAAATAAVQQAGFVAAVVQKPIPGGTVPAGLVWGSNPGVQDEPCGSTVTIYAQP